MKLKLVPSTILYLFKAVNSWWLIIVLLLGIRVDEIMTQIMTNSDRNSNIHHTFIIHPHDINHEIPTMKFPWSSRASREFLRGVRFGTSRMADPVVKSIFQQIEAMAGPWAVEPPQDRWPGWGAGDLFLGGKNQKKMTWVCKNHQFLGVKHVKLLQHQSFFWVKHVKLWNFKTFVAKKLDILDFSCSRPLPLSKTSPLCSRIIRSCSRRTRLGRGPWAPGDGLLQVITAMYC